MPKSYRNVEVFATGHHHGRDWTLADLQQAVTNWNALRTIKNADGSPLLDPPLWVGHEELPELNDRTDLPRFGGVNALAIGPKRPDGETPLVAGFNDVHPELSSWIDQGKITDISAEFYEDFVDEKGKHWGIVLRRVCCLGATPPAVKSLNTFRDQRPTHAFASKQKTFTIRTVFKFADAPGGSTMDRKQVDEMLAGIIAQQNLPLTKEFIAGLDDDQAAQLLKDLTGGGNPPPDPNAPPAGFADDAAKAKAAADKAAADAAAQSQLTPAALTVKFQDMMKRQLAELVTPLKQELTQTKRELAAVRQQTSDTLREEKSRKVHAFMDRMVDDGKGNCKVLPADRDRLTAQLMRADTVNKVVKFGDGDKAETLTELDAQMRTIEALPVIKKFGDKMPVDAVRKTAYDDARKGVVQKIEAERSKQGKTLEQRLGMRPLAGMV
jgi:hypothetical protein